MYRYPLNLSVTFTIPIHSQQMEEIWREVRWMMDALQHARYKQPACAVPLTWFLNAAGDILLKDQPPPNSSHLDYFPSPNPSPETNRKHNNGKWALKRR